MTERWRCFVAVSLGGSLSAELVTAVAGWRTRQPADDLRWAEPEAWHITLAFLGMVAPADVPRIEASIRARAVAHPPTVVPTGGLGAFRGPGRASVLWYGVHDAERSLATIARDIAETLGVSHDEPYRPHVTLARARRRPVDLRGWIEGAGTSAPRGRLTVERLELKRSHRGPGPARYETLGAFTLGGAP